MTVMEKLLVPATTGRIVDHGYDEVGGPVYRADDLLGRSPRERVAAHRLAGPPWPFGDDPDHVDVVRFATWPTASLTTPTSPATPGERPMPLYEVGFLHDGAPVWHLTTTRLPAGARFVRVARDGTEKELSSYGGAAWGWQGSRGYFPPLHLVGPRAQWQGRDLPGSFSEDHGSFELVRVGDQDVPEGFREARPKVFVREVRVTDCDAIFEVVLNARWRDVDVRVIQSAGEEVLVQLLDPTVESVDVTRATALDPWTFQATAPRSEVTDLHGVRNEAYGE